MLLLSWSLSGSTHSISRIILQQVAGLMIASVVVHFSTRPVTKNNIISTTNMVMVFPSVVWLIFQSRPIWTMIPWESFLISLRIGRVVQNVGILVRFLSSLCIWIRRLGISFLYRIRFSKEDFGARDAPSDARQGNANQMLITTHQDLTSQDNLVITDVTNLDPAYCSNLPENPHGKGLACQGEHGWVRETESTITAADNSFQEDHSEDGRGTTVLIHMMEDGWIGGCESRVTIVEERYMQVVEDRKIKGFLLHKDILVLLLGYETMASIVKTCIRKYYGAHRDNVTPPPAADICRYLVSNATSIESLQTFAAKHQHTELMVTAMLVDRRDTKHLYSFTLSKEENSLELIPSSSCLKCSLRGDALDSAEGQRLFRQMSRRDTKYVAMSKAKAVFKEVAKSHPTSGGYVHLFIGGPEVPWDCVLVERLPNYFDLKQTYPLPWKAKRPRVLG